MFPSTKYYPVYTTYDNTCHNTYVGQDDITGGGFQKWIQEDSKKGEDEKRETHTKVKRKCILRRKDRPLGEY